MTLLPRGLKVHLALGYTDMRKGIDVLGHVGSGGIAPGSVLRRCTWFEAAVGGSGRHAGPP
jgi:hypothetical protein